MQLLQLVVYIGQGPLWVVSHSQGGPMLVLTGGGDDGRRTACKSGSIAVVRVPECSPCVDEKEQE